LPRVGADIAINTKTTAIINIIKLINRSNVLFLIDSTPYSSKSDIIPTYPVSSMMY